MKFEPTDYWCVVVIPPAAGAGAVFVVVPPSAWPAVCGFAGEFRFMFEAPAGKLLLD